MASADIGDIMRSLLSSWPAFFFASFGMPLCSMRCASSSASLVLSSLSDSSCWIAFICSFR